MASRNPATQTNIQGRILFLVFATLSCLVLGGLVAWLLTEPGPSQTNNNLSAVAPTMPFTPSPTAGLGTQRTILLLVIDSLTVPQPKLEGIWVLTFIPGTSEYFWVGLSPQSIVPATGRSLEMYFAESPAPYDRADFTMTGIMQLTDSGFQPTLSVTIDRPLLIELVELLGGIAIDGQHLNGEGLLAYYDSLPPDQQLLFQKAALEAFIRKAQAAAWREDLLETLYYHYQTVSPDADELLRLAIEALPFSEAKFNYSLWEETDAAQEIAP
ncbi:MAG: hypothetical protein NZM11_02350 [Anaerolineales bacterium]|nr:hypothetical protein [Anaerolineales bacterium]